MANFLIVQSGMKDSGTNCLRRADLGRKRQRDAQVAPASAVSEPPPSAANELVSEEEVATPLGRTPERASTAVRGKVCRSAALADAMEEDDDAAEAALGDDVLLSKPLGYRLSLALVTLRRRLREFLAEQADAEKSVPMQKTDRGFYPTMRWTIRFGQWLGTTRVFESKASKWHFPMCADARADAVTVRSGRGENSVYLYLGFST